MVRFLNYLAIGLMMVIALAAIFVGSVDVSTRVGTALTEVVWGQQ